MPPMLKTVFDSVLEAKSLHSAAERSCSLSDEEKAVCKGIYNAMFNLIKDLHKEREFSDYEQMRNAEKRK